MVMNRALLSLGLTFLLDCLVSGSQFTTTAECNFTFSLGDFPNFLLPEAGPNSPGDVQLNVNNSIITRGWNESDVNNTLHSCNGQSSAYYIGDDTWETTYVSNNGDELEIDIFYATFQDQLWVRHLQPHMDPSLYEVLNNTVVRLNITCALEINSCIEFTVDFTDATPYNYTAPYEFQDDCAHGFSSGVQVPLVNVHAASPVGPKESASLGPGVTLILAGKADQGLPWSEGFEANGTKKTDEFWGKWWATVDTRFNSSEFGVDSGGGGGGDPCNDFGGVPDPDDIVCCHAACNTYESDATHFQNNRVCTRDKMLTHNYVVCGVDGVVAPCEYSGYDSLGCYRDNKRGSRIMTIVASRSDMTAELCSGLCAGSKQFGTQLSSQCWCGPEDADTDYARFGTSPGCKYTCTGDQQEICGGVNAMSVYGFIGSVIKENAFETNEENGCTGNTAQFWDPRYGVWRSSYQTIDEKFHAIDMFYMNLVEGGANELWVTEIESWMAPSLYNQLQYNYVKLSLTCPGENAVVDSCVIFKPTFTNWSPEIDGTIAGYRFSDPALPSFDLPPAVPNSPGDIVLSTTSSIVTKTGATTETLCNGDSAEYYGEDGFWYHEFVRSTGVSYGLKHVFYPKQRKLYAATIQADWDPNLRRLLANRTVRLRIWCTNDERAEYLFFRVSGTSATCTELPKLCTEVSDSVGNGAVQLLPMFSQCATTLSAAYLGWLMS